MLTTEDLEKLSGIFGDKVKQLKDDLQEDLSKKFADFLPKIIEAEKAVFVTKTEFDAAFERQSEEFSKLQSSVDGFMGKIERQETERLAMGSRIDRHEKWIKQAADTVGVQFGHKY